MNKKWDKINGVIPPIITPFDEYGEIDERAFTKNIEKWNKDELAGYLVNGSNGETAFMNVEEKLKLVKLIAKHRAPDRHLMVGTGNESLRETISFTKACADLGAHSALVLTPHFYDGAMTSEVLIEFFTKVADNSPIPILIYNVPKFTHVNIHPNAIEELSKHPNIVGMKDSSGNVAQLANFLRVSDRDFQIFVGTASAWYQALCMGIEGGIMALANCLPNECKLVQKYFDAGDLNKAFNLYQVLLPVNTYVTSTYGIPGLKFACEIEGYQGGRVRSPLLNCSEEAMMKIEEMLKSANRKVKSIILEN